MVSSLGPLIDRYLADLDTLHDFIKTGTGPAGADISQVDGVDSDNPVQTVLDTSLELAHQAVALGHEGLVDLGQV